MPVVSMSKKEFDRLEVLLGVRSGRLHVADACALLGLKRRQGFRLLAGLKHGGAASLVSKRRGRPSNNRLPETYRDLRCRWFANDTLIWQSCTLVRNYYMQLDWRV